MNDDQELELADIENDKFQFSHAMTTSLRACHYPSLPHERTRPFTSTMSTTPSILAWLKRKTPARAVLITGASGGLGAYIAGAFDAAGARQIVLCGRDEAALQQTAASIVMARVEILIFDVTSEEAVEKALAHAWPPLAGSMCSSTMPPS